MRECPNGLIRDRLPDLLHDRLPAVERAEVRAHVAQCADCRAELALLERVRGSAMAPRIDTPRIVAALPPYRAVSAWSRALASPLLRIAAAVVLTLGAVSVLARQLGDGGRDRTAVERVAARPAAPTRPSVDTPRRSSPPVSPRAAAPMPAELAIGEGVQDLSDAELRALLDELESFETLTPAETEVVLPALTRGRGDA